jgi:hypothetical protein
MKGMNLGGDARSIGRKIAVSLLIGALSFSLTNILFETVRDQVLVSAAVGGVVLIVQFLIAVEQGLYVNGSKQREQIAEIKNDLHSGFANVNGETRLIERAKSAGLTIKTIEKMVDSFVKLSNDPPILVSAVAQSTIEGAIEFVRDIAGQKVSCKGEENVWLSALVENSRVAIDAVSRPQVDAGGRVFKGGFWSSANGREYMDLQRQAVQRGVRVRRVFIGKNLESVDESDLFDICRTQAELGIEVRILRRPPQFRAVDSHLYDFVLFDDVLSYEITPAVPTESAESPLIMTTQINWAPEKILERKSLYAELWRVADPFPDNEPAR